ncbi:unnamed protein product [Closterium sp. NIES-64]|nr:unnamed protein product [Closterium sp. NIES-64]
MAASFVAFLLYLTQPEGSGENPSPDDASAASAGKTGVNGAEEEEEANWEEASRRVREQQARALLAAPDPLTAALAIPVRQLAAVDSKRMAAVPAIIPSQSLSCADTLPPAPVPLSTAVSAAPASATAGGDGEGGRGALGGHTRTGGSLGYLSPPNKGAAVTTNSGAAGDLINGPDLASGGTPDRGAEKGRRPEGIQRSVSDTAAISAGSTAGGAAFSAARTGGGAGGGTRGEGGGGGIGGVGVKVEVAAERAVSPVAPQPMIYEVKVDLLAAKNLPAANISGTADPYAIVSCGTERRFSSVIPSSRNPMWAEEFRFFAPCLPALVSVRTYDWDIISKNAELGAASLLVEGEALPFTAWYPLDKGMGQVCLQLQVTAVPRNKADSTAAKGAAISSSRLRRLSQQPTSAGAGDKQEGEAFEGERPEQQQQEQEAGRGTEVRLKPGPLQTIFGLPPDEVIRHSFSCALERSFLYHGRMFLSGAHLCFHSNVFSKELTVCIPYQDIEEVRRSTHALINPAMTVVLHLGTGGHGVPPLPSPDAMAVVLHLGTGGHGVPPLPSPDAMTAVLHLGTGGRGRGATSSQPSRVKYKFASFWNRGHAMRLLQEAIAEFWKTEEAAALVRSLCPWCPARCAHHHRLSCLLGSRSVPAAAGGHCQVLEKRLLLWCVSIFLSSPLALRLGGSMQAVPAAAGGHCRLSCCPHYQLFRPPRCIEEEEQDRLRAISMRDGALEGLSFRGAALEAAEEEKEKQPFLDLTVLEHLLQVRVVLQGAASKAAEQEKEKQPFFDLTVLEHLLQFEVPCTAETYFNLLYSDSSDFVVVYRAKRKDTELKVGEWKETEQYGGKMREVRFHALLATHPPIVQPPCLHSTPSLPHSPFSTAMTDWCGTRDFMLCLPRTHPSFSRPACTAPPLSPTPLSPLPWPIGGVWSGTQDFMLCLPRTHPSFSRHACTLSPTPRLPCAPTQVTYRSLCDSPMCPPSTAMTEWLWLSGSTRPFLADPRDLSSHPYPPPCLPRPPSSTAMTEWQHMAFSAPDHNHLVLELINQAHDVPFGSYFEVHAQWTVKTTSDNPESPSCSAELKAGVHFKKWCMMQGKIRQGAQAEMKRNSQAMMEMAMTYIAERTQGGNQPADCNAAGSVGADSSDSNGRGNGGDVKVEEGGEAGGVEGRENLVPGGDSRRQGSVDTKPGRYVAHCWRKNSSACPFTALLFIPYVFYPTPFPHSPTPDGMPHAAREGTAGPTVCRTLLEKGQLGLSLQDLTRFTALPPPSLRSALLVLVQHNCAQAFRPQTEDTGPLARTPTLYIALQDSILPRLRFPKFMAQTNELLGDEHYVQAEAVVEALLGDHSHLSRPQLVKQPKFPQCVILPFLPAPPLPLPTHLPSGKAHTSPGRGSGGGSFGARPPGTAIKAEAVVEALLEHGRLSLHQLVQRSVAKAGSSDPSAAKTEGQVRQQLVAALSVLIHERLVERVGAPEPMLPARGASSGGDAPKPAARARVVSLFSLSRHSFPLISHSGNDGVVGVSDVGNDGIRMRATMESSGYFDSEEHRVVVAARCSHSHSAHSCHVSLLALSAHACHDGIRTRAMMESSGYFDSEEHRVVIAARCSDALRFQLPAAWVLSGGDGAGGNAVSAAAVDGSAGADGGMSAAAAAKLKLPAAWVLSGGGGAGGGAASAAAVDGSTGTDGGMSAAAAAKLKGKRVVLDADDAEEEQAGPSAKRQALAALHHTVFPISALAPHPTAPPLQRKRVVLDDDDEEEQAGPSAKRPALRKRVVLDDDDEEEQAGPSAKRLATGAAPHNRKRVVLDDDDDEEQAGPSAKRPATGAAAGGGEKQGGGGEDSGVLWRVNYEEFLRRTRHRTIVDFVRESIDPGASIITAALLHAGKNQETSLRHPYSASLSLDSIVNAVRGTEDGRTMALDRIRAALQLLVAHPSAVASRSSDAHYTIRESSICACQTPTEGDYRASMLWAFSHSMPHFSNLSTSPVPLLVTQVEAIVSQRFGPSACRLFRLLLSKNCLEQKQAAELAMISLADARQLLYRMMLDEFVQLQEVPKTADHAPQRTFYLWRIHIGTVLPRVLNHMCHGACNLRLRLEHEMQQEQEVLSLLEQIEQAHAAHSTGGAASSAGGGGGAPEKAVALTSGQRKQLERIRRVAAVLETSLLRLDNTITLFSAF